MKINQILTGCIAALTLAGAAQAATNHIYLTGSSAFRAQANAGLQALYGAPVAQDNAALGSANNVMFKKLNYPNPGDTTYVKTTWNGSGAGVQAVAAGSSLPANTQIKLTYYSDVAAGTGTPAALGSETAVPDVALSDVYQGTTGFTGTGVRNTGTINPATGAVNHALDVTTTYEDLSGQDVLCGVVCFRFVGSTGFPGTNMTPQLAQILYPIGKQALSQYTGLAADATKLVFAIGRNPDSGTRATAFAESGVGVGAAVKQYSLTENAGTATITGQTLFPYELINGVSTGAIGNSGYSSGGTLRGFLTDTIPAAIYQAPASGGSATTTGAYYVTYLGTSDAATVTAGQVAPRGNAVALNYNGVAYTAAAVQNGQYTFWGYEHIAYRAAAVGTLAETVALDLQTQVTGTNLNPNNVNLSDMVVGRGNDGGLIN